jgi:hypothetical protein
MVETKALVIFEERSYQALYEDFRIFIQGVDVTPWVTGSVSVTRTNRDGPNTCTFTLDNAMDRFVLTDENLNDDKWRDTNDRYSEAAKHGIYLYKTGQAEVTQDRVAEMAKVLFSRNNEIVEARTSIEVERDQKNDRRRRGTRNKQRQGDADQTLENEILRVTASDTLQDMPADTILNHTDSVKLALRQQLIEQGMPDKLAQKLAD